MKEEKFNIDLGEREKVDLIIRQTEDLNELEILAPLKTNLSGVIGAPLEFLRKRISEKNQINQKRCHIIVDRENLTIVLVINEDDPYLDGSVTGKLQHHPKYKEFGINAGKSWDPNELGQFCKMNRAFFLNKTENMELVTKLKNFDAKIQTVVEKHKAETGDFKDNYSGVVTSNLPGAFKLKIPLFKGRPAEEIEVEFYAAINGRTVGLQLFSPGANQATEELRDQTINDQLKQIAELAPDIAIIET
jgi:hypothetical protein